MAQLVAHPLDVREVTSSSLVSSTIELRSCNGTAAFSCPNQSRLELVTRAKLVVRGICRADRRRMPVAKRQAIRKFESCIVHHEKEPFRKAKRLFFREAHLRFASLRAISAKLHGASRFTCRAKRQTSLNSSPILCKFPVDIFPQSSYTLAINIS